MTINIKKTIRIGLIPFLFAVPNSIFGQTEVDAFPDFTQSRKDSFVFFYVPHKRKIYLKDTVEMPYFQWIDSASVAANRKDTLLAIQYLQKYVSSPTDNAMKEIYGYRLGYICNKLINKELAKKVFVDFLNSKKETGSYSLEPVEFSPLISGFESNSESGFDGGFRHNACLRLYEMAVAEKSYQEAFKHLNDANDKFPVQSSCGNGYDLYQGRLETKFGEYYLTTKDTANAIRILFENILFEDKCSRKAIDLLREVLYKKYSNAQVVKEIRRGIESVGYLDDRNDITGAQLRFFGQKVLWKYWLIKDMNIESIKKRFSDNWAIKELMKGKYTPLSIKD